RGDLEDVRCDLPELLPPREPLLGRLGLAEERAVLEHAVVVEGHGDDVQRTVEARAGLGADEGVEGAELGWAQSPVASEAALQEDPQCHAVARDELDVALEDL